MANTENCLIKLNMRVTAASGWLERLVRRFSHRTFFKDLSLGNWSLNNLSHFEREGPKSTLFSRRAAGVTVRMSHSKQKSIVSVLAPWRTISREPYRGAHGFQTFHSYDALADNNLTAKRWASRERTTCGLRSFNLPWLSRRRTAETLSGRRMVWTASLP